MASVSRDSNGTKRVCFTDGTGKRHVLRLGRVNVRQAEEVRVRVEALLAARMYRRSPDVELLGWLNGLDDRVHRRFANKGLVPHRERAAGATLESLIKRFLDASTVKPATLAAYKQTTDSLLEVLGRRTPVTEITPADADHWRKAISEKGDRRKPLAAATIAKRVHVAKCIFSRARRWKLVPENPFEHLRAGPQSNPDRAFYVRPEVAQRIIDQCPCPQWKAIIALSRFAGLRCPSEIVELRWGDINWERSLMTVRSPKTAAHDGHAVRIVPITPELRPILQALFDQAPEGSEAVVPRLTDPTTNLRTTFMKLIARAGYEPWPRLFHNMRASCATDWAEALPAHVVAKWLGHSPLVAAKHYLQTRDAHFEVAIRGMPRVGEAEAQAAAIRATA